MLINYEKKVVPFEAGCCFLPFSSNFEPSVNTSPKLFKNTHHESNSLLTENEQKIKKKKEGIQAMKKSISTINLKRKYSDGFATNRLSLNQSQFQFKPQKRFITHSMDTEVLKNYIPFHQKRKDLNSGGISEVQYQEKRPQYFLHGHDTLDSLAEKFKKNRDIKIQQYVEQTKKRRLCQYPDQRFLQTQTLQKTYAKQFYRFPNQIQKHDQHLQNLPNMDELDFTSAKKELDVTKSLQDMKNFKLIGVIQSYTNQDQKNPLKIEMNQVDSMILEINPPKKISTIEKKVFLRKGPCNLGVNKQITQSIHFGESSITKKKKKSFKGQRELANYDTMTIKSDYEEDQHQKIEKIQESAIMMNFFNPPSFIKEKLILSQTKHA